MPHASVGQLSACIRTPEINQLKNRKDIWARNPEGSAQSHLILLFWILTTCITVGNCEMKQDNNCMGARNQTKREENTVCSHTSFEGTSPSTPNPHSILSLKVSTTSYKYHGLGPNF